MATQNPSIGELCGEDRYDFKDGGSTVSDLGWTVSGISQQPLAVFKTEMGPNANLDKARSEWNTPRTVDKSNVNLEVWPTGEPGFGEATERHVVKSTARSRTARPCGVGAECRRPFRFSKYGGRDDRSEDNNSPVKIQVPAFKKHDHDNTRMR